MISIHGLIRGDNIEMGRDTDTGGQVRYVVEMIKELAEYNEVDKIDLFTRQIKDKRVSADYSKHIEQISPKCRIIRFPCGGGKYIRKEKLWPHLEEYVDRIIEFIRIEKRIPDIVHGHYADAGYIASEIASVFGIPFFFTAHSLGRNKLSFLLDNGLTREKADRQFSINNRIKQEERILTQADIVLTSTNYEKDFLYRYYHNCELPQYEVIPPGLDLKHFFPYYEYKLITNNITEICKQSQIRMIKELERFHINPDKPLILTLCRPDKRKNIDILIETYGRDKELQALCNLAIFAGLREDIGEMEDEEKKVLTDILLLMDKYDLYGKMAIPKHHSPDNDVPELYRLAASQRGVFVSTSFLETFGLTLIEASATGLPFIASDKGGPKDIVHNLNSGMLIDINNREELASSIKKILTNKEKWEQLSNNGINNVRKIYTWKSHCDKYLSCIINRIEESDKRVRMENYEYQRIGRRLSSVKYLLIVDIDDTLIGNREAVNELILLLKHNHDEIAFGVATGRYKESAADILKMHGIENVDIIISSTGSEIYYGPSYIFDKGYAHHIRVKWKPEKIKAVLKKFDFIGLQKEDNTQRDFKISYYLDSKIDESEAFPVIHTALSEAHLAYNLISSYGTYIDILPYRASKGKAVRYLSNKWKIPLKNIVTAGNSGNDRDMLNGNICGIVVGNYEKELESLRNTNRVYFSRGFFAKGIIEGIGYYGLLNRCPTVV